jgi:hypothetical protein
MESAIKHNTDKGNIEIHFLKKPGDKTIEQIRVYGWQWSKSNKCWYMKQSRHAEAFARKITAGLLSSMCFVVRPIGQL